MAEAQLDVVPEKARGLLPRHSRDDLAGNGQAKASSVGVQRLKSWSVGGRCSTGTCNALLTAIIENAGAAPLVG